MAYYRFFNSDIYVFETSDNLCCQLCCLVKPKMVYIYKPAVMLNNLMLLGFSKRNKCSIIKKPIDSPKRLHKPTSYKRKKVNIKREKVNVKRSLIAVNYFKPRYIIRTQVFFGDYTTKYRTEMIEHIKKHQTLGHFVDNIGLELLEEDLKKEGNLVN